MSYIHCYTIYPFLCKFCYEGFTGAKESTSKVTHSCAQHVRAVCWLETSVSHHMDLCVTLYSK